MDWPSHCLSTLGWVHTTKFTAQNTQWPEPEIQSFSEDLHKNFLNKNHRVYKERNRGGGLNIKRDGHDNRLSEIMFPPD